VSDSTDPFVALDRSIADTVKRTQLETRIHKRVRVLMRENGLVYGYSEAPECTAMLPANLRPDTCGAFVASPRYQHARASCTQQQGSYDKELVCNLRMMFGLADHRVWQTKR
jgi:hypothetical protein